MPDFIEMALEQELVPGVRAALEHLRDGGAHALLPEIRETALSGAETITFPIHEALALIVLACIMAEVGAEIEAEDEAANAAGAPHG